MNRFSSSEYSLFKSSFVACFLNFVEHYRPKCFLLENVRNLARYRKSLLLKMMCSFFVRLGYQLRVGVLQAGCHGVPQNRRRLFIIGSVGGVSLPPFPEPTHMFSSKHCDTSFRVNSKKYDCFQSKLALFRMVTIEDAIADLTPLSENNYFQSELHNYAPNCNLTHYQRMLGSNSKNLVNNHYCKQLTKLNRERIKRIPHTPGSDWRDLPNIE